MNLPFPKSLFLELGRYPLFVDFVQSHNLINIPSNIDSVEFRHKELKGYKLYLHDNIIGAIFRKASCILGSCFYY